MADRLAVTEDTTLLVFLVNRLDGWSRKKIKQRLQGGLVMINDLPTTQHDMALTTGDVVEVLATKKHSAHGGEQLEVLYSDRDLVAINKPAGLLSVGAGSETKNHALSLLRKQLSGPRRPVKLWPVHRLDKETSGVLLFATSKEMREAVSARWTDAKKTYLAIVQGTPDPAQGTIDQPLYFDAKGLRSHVGPHPEAQRAITHYVTEDTGKGRSLLKVTIDTGRQHQIRAHLAWLGHPVVGDGRYGTKAPCMGLHAFRLSIIHPQNGKELVFETPPPKNFLALSPHS
jgi:23S rRNA pseudouridine1911/1915/1917 synthase